MNERQETWRDWCRNRESRPWAASAGASPKPALAPVRRLCDGRHVDTIRVRRCSPGASHEGCAADRVAEVTSCDTPAIDEQVSAVDVGPASEFMNASAKACSSGCPRLPPSPTTAEATASPMRAKNEVNIGVRVANALTVLTRIPRSASC